MFEASLGYIVIPYVQKTSRQPNKLKRQKIAFHMKYNRGYSYQGHF